MPWTPDIDEIRAMLRSLLERGVAKQHTLPAVVRLPVMKSWLVLLACVLQFSSAEKLDEAHWFRVQASISICPAALTSFF